MTIFIITVFTAAACFAAKNKGLPPAVPFCFLIIPLFGPVLFFCACAAERLARKKRENGTFLDEEESQFDLPSEQPDMDGTIVPVKEVLETYTDREKKRFLINQLKRGTKESYNVLVLALNDGNTDSAHFASVARMEMRRICQDKWFDARRAYEAGPYNESLYHESMDALTELICSGVFTDRECTAYRRRLCHMTEEHMDDASSGEWARYLLTLVELGYHEKALEVWKGRGCPLDEEDTRKAVMTLYYETGNMDGLKDVADRLDTMRLSDAEKEQAVYWKEYFRKEDGK